MPDPGSNPLIWNTWYSIEGHRLVELKIRSVVTDRGYTKRKLRPMNNTVNLVFLTSLLTAVLVLVTSAGDVAAEIGGSASLEVVVSGLRSDRGQVRVFLFDSADGYPSKRERAAHKSSSSVSNGVGMVRFSGLQPGTYAAFAYHDEDGNGDLQSNWIGMPKEGVGASKNARGRMGPPRFKDAAFNLKQGPSKISFKLTYL